MEYDTESSIFFTGIDWYFLTHEQPLNAIALFSQPLSCFTTYSRKGTIQCMQPLYNASISQMTPALTMQNGLWWKFISELSKVLSYHTYRRGPTAHGVTSRHWRLSQVSLFASISVLNRAESPPTPLFSQAAIAPAVQIHKILQFLFISLGTGPIVFSQWKFSFLRAEIERGKLYERTSQNLSMTT